VQTQREKRKQTREMSAKSAAITEGGRGVDKHLRAAKRNRKGKGCRGLAQGMRVEVAYEEKREGIEKDGGEGCIERKKGDGAMGDQSRGNPGAEFLKKEVIELLPDEWQKTGSARLGKRVRRAIMDADEITGFADASVVGYLPADKSDFVRCLCVCLRDRVCGVVCVCASMCPRACVRVSLSLSLLLSLCVRAQVSKCVYLSGWLCVCDNGPVKSMCVSVYTSRNPKP
jgi:hypothetical protein